MDAGILCNKAAVLGTAMKDRSVQIISEVVKCVMSYKPILFAQNPSLHCYQDPKTI
jgi:hypothetical protein